MADGETPAAPRYARALFRAGVSGAASDEQLVERFRNRGDRADAEVAFAVLVARHGPMVLGVCRRALRDPNDAADAFQATFLVLVRKAGSVRVEGSLGRWLYGVSRRVAARARADAARRSARETREPGPEPAGPDPGDGPERRELFAALDEEVARLPEPFRTAVVLCDLGGLSHEAAAGHLGCPVGTIESRLSRGRKRLRERLTRRGLAPALAVSPPPAVPESLSLSAVHAATGTRAVLGPVTALIEGVITDMAWTRLKTLALEVGAVALACGLVAVAAQRLKADPTPKTNTEPSSRAARDAEPVLQPPARMKPGDSVLIEVLEALPGRPISGSRTVRPDGTISLGFYGDLKVAGLTRNEIKVKVIERLLKTLPESILGLEEQDPDGKIRAVPPSESNKVYVDDSLNSEMDRRAPDLTARKLDQILEAIQAQGPAGTRQLIDHERRLAQIEQKLELLIKAVADRKNETK